VNVTLRIPDDLVQRLSAGGDDISRRALEAFALAEYRAGRLTRPELRRLLGFATRAELDGLLKQRGIDESMTVAEFERDREDLDRLGVASARRSGFAVTGTLGLLDRGARRGLADLVTAFAALRTTNFHTRQELLDALLAQHRKA
jgi:hypothetical protein